VLWWGCSIRSSLAYIAVDLALNGSVGSGKGYDKERGYAHYEEYPRRLTAVMD
jgi:hypothetical protein